MVDVSFTSQDLYATITGADNLQEILPDIEYEAAFNFSVAENAPIGHVVEFEVHVTGQNYSTTETGYFTIGLTIEDFETGNFANLPWNFGGNTDWEITTDSQEGS